MAINWFPGHMNKARKEIRKVLSQVDLVIEVLDARIPFSSANPMIDRLTKTKPRIKLLNKSDLADQEQTLIWQQFLESDRQVKTLAINANQDVKAKVITQLCRKLVTDKAPDRAITAMVVGIPNVGKSTLLNGLAGKAIAKVGNEPAVTKRQQKISVNDEFAILDTPGILWPKLEPESCGYRLAITGAIRDTAMEYEDVALYALDYLKQAYPERLCERYRLDGVEVPELELLERIGSKRGCLRAGGVVDLYQAASILLQDCRSGKLGGITFETPEMMEQELEELRQLIAEKKAAQQEQESVEQKSN